MMADWLDQMVGVWTYDGRMVPDDPAQARTGTEHVTRRGAWLVIEGEDYRFQFSMDPETGKLAGDFVHWEHPFLWTYEGEVEADGRLHLYSRGPDMEGKDGEREYDDTFEIVSPDIRLSQARVKDENGQWRDFSRTTYTRVK
jgi:hypothetical protein